MTEQLNESWDCIIVGGGAAGLSAALMLGRSRRTTLVVDAGSPRNRFAHAMHGVLGHEGLNPADLLAKGRIEAANFGVEFAEATVKDVSETEAGIRVTLDNGQKLQSRTLLVATGLTDRLPNVDGLADNWGSTVLHCPYCHGWEVRDGALGVLMTGPMSAHQVQLVRQLSDNVTLFTGGTDLAPDITERLQARSVAIDPRPIESVKARSGGLTLTFADDETLDVTAIFTHGEMEPHDSFLAGLELERTETPMGQFIRADAMGQTSHKRIWAAGNIVNPGASVPIASGAGSMAGAAVNAALVSWDFDAAVDQIPSRHWESRYRDADSIWSGAVNPTMAEAVANLPGSRALDLGCGEGADAIWLARGPWSVTAVDISPTAIERGRQAAAAAGIPQDTIEWVAADLATWEPPAKYDLVTASFLHSTVELPRLDILRRAAFALNPGGHLVIVTHAAAPPWARIPDDEGAHWPHHRFLTPDEEIELLALPESSFTVLTQKLVRREANGPDGQSAELTDGLIVVKRRS